MFKPKTKNSKKIKQVIVIRKDLNMRRGKECAQASHASIAFLRESALNESFLYQVGQVLSLEEVAWEWLKNGMTKITVQVDSEQELIDIFKKAKEAKLEVHMITDAGATEFNGVPTKTCLAIGPDYEDKIDLITGQLKLR